MRNLKKALSLTLALALSLTLAVPAFAAGTDVTVDQEGITATIKNVLRKETHKYRVAEREGRVEAAPVVKEITIYVVSNEGTEISFVPNREEASRCFWRYKWDAEKNCLVAVGGDGGVVESPETEEIRPYDKEAPVSFTSFNCSYNGAFEGNYIIVMTEGAFARLVPVDGEPGQPAKKLAKAADQNITIDGKAVAFQTYVLSGTNYVKLRDIAHVLNGTGASFSVGYDSKEKSISVDTGKAYQDTGTEMDTPFAGANKEFKRKNLTILVNGSSVELDALSMKDDSGNGYTYFKLRDLGKALGFNVGYNGGVYIETDKPYVG